ncbi:MAG: ead/Ea22-like family protein [Klebsiella pneumoniae]|nr:ead/Ea22-like family protein [Klebsiella pneumoniae]
MLHRSPVYAVTDEKKGSTITLQAVNELIASLESAGELSIKETKVMALAKAFKQLAEENVELKSSRAILAENALESCNSIACAGFRHEAIMLGLYASTGNGNKYPKPITTLVDEAMRKLETPATDRIVAGIKADGRVEGAHFVANRMLAAWDAGFIKDTAKNAADIARMILTSTEFMADAPEGDFDRSFADGILEDIAQQLREGAK